MKVVATRKAEQNQAIVDPWTVVHFAMGLAAGLMNVPPALALGGAVAYEVAEHAFQRTEMGQAFFNTSGPEVIPNAVADVVVFAVGQYLGDQWNKS